MNEQTEVQHGVGQVRAPIALFAYKRPVHLRRTWESLRANHGAAQSDLIVYCDGAKTAADVAAVSATIAEVRRLAAEGGFRSVEVVARLVNHGLARSIIAGVSAAVERWGRVIVVEDDLLTSPHFLTFMNDGLDLYADDERVASVHGYLYPVTVPASQTFFLRGADCWGWATWQRAWRHFREDGAMLLIEIERGGHARRFDYNGMRRLVGMLKDQVAGRNNSWAIRWHASAFLNDMYTLYPTRSLVQNIGNDASGTHCGDDDGYTVEMCPNRLAVERIPIVEDEAAWLAIAHFYCIKRRSFRAVFGWVARRIRSLLP